MVVVIPCGGKKRPGRWKAFRLYSGPYFQKALAAALRLTTSNHIFILSGKHGLLRLNQEVDSYEQRIDAPGAITASAVAEQAASLGIDREPSVVVLAGAVYAGIAKTVWPNAQTPLLGLSGMGYQMQFLKEIARSGRLP